MGGQRWMFSELGDTLAERTGLYASIALSGHTFTRSLMPRTVLGQALATGMTGALNYGTVTAMQSAYWSAARLAVSGVLPAVWPAGEDPPPRLERLIVHGTNVAAVAAGASLELAFAQKPGEPLRRAAIRTFGTRIRRAALAGAVTAAVLDATDEVADRLHVSRKVVNSAAITVLLGSAIAGWTVYSQRRRGARFDAERAATATPAPEGSGMAADDLSTEDTRTSALMSGAAGVAASVGLVALGRSEELFARLVARGLRPVLPHHSDIRLAVGHCLGLGILVGGIGFGIERVYRSTEQAGDVVEGAYSAPPEAATVSGGPGSAVDWTTLSREGRRFVNMVLSPQAIASVMGADSARQPVRAFVGLESAPTPQDRARLLVEELDRLGGFERQVLCFASPTGTGYINYVLTEALEYLTLGDCATAGIQYSLRPSFLSLDRVRVGRENNIAFFHELQRKLQTMPAADRPRLLLFGESLGAHTAQDAFLHQGTDGLHRAGVDRALFIGTPDGSKWAKGWRADPALCDPAGEVVEVASYDEFSALPAEVRARARFVLLTHHEDPIGKFGPEIAIQQPSWLGPARTRPQGVPPEMKWLPFMSFFVTLADVLNAMHVVPGVFGNSGHDYRADLPVFTGAVFGFQPTPQQAASMEKALRDRELRWAQRQIVAEQLDKAKAAVQKTLSQWNVPGSEGLDRLVTLAANDPVTGVVAQTPGATALPAGGQSLEQTAAAP
ncbi:MAG: hypothetical protein EPO13_00860 [Actinomycetota bacterium]|nr:MAG: hypothetical protein EPO13_00860 [Actinomycetota bacterium]